MDTNKFKVLVHILKVGSLSQAAEDLNYTTSGISRLIMSMEEELGFPLLIRSKSGVTATPECQTLLVDIKALLRSSLNLAQSINRIKGIETGTLTIGTSSRTYYKWLAKLMADFKKLYPHIHIHLMSLNSTQMLEAMDRHEVDFCIASQRNKHLTWVPLEDNPIVVWLPNDHPLANGPVPLSALKNIDYIDSYPNEDTDNARFLNRHGIKVNTQYTTTDDYATYCLVEAGLGIALNNDLNLGSWQGKVTIQPLDPPQYVSIGIAYPKKGHLSPIAKKFIEFTQNKSHAEQKTGSEI